MSSLLKEQVIEQLDGLSEEKQRKVLDYARGLHRKKKAGLSGKEMVQRFAGLIPSEDADEMLKIIEEDCEQIDADNW